MLFNSHAFLWGFLPLALGGYFALGRWRGAKVALGFLAAASLVFYAVWDPKNLLVLVPSLLGNFAMGRVITGALEPWRKRLLIAGLVGNLGALAYYKYAVFFLQTAATLTGIELALTHVVLPLGISFFTFEQIAYLVDTYRGQSRRYRFWEYTLFVLFFPHLIAGPIIQHDELLDQLGSDTHEPRQSNLAIGLTLFVFGMVKKAVIADTLAVYVGPIYDATSPDVPTAFFAWLGTVAYSLQLYFDFSGYSDMAIGLARLFNLKLPQNFNSPYQAHNIIEFWRRWHMTLSRFLRTYLYIPVGGNHGSTLRRHLNLMVTMLLGGLWHGAGWGFVLWGGLNGLYLVANHLYRAWRGETGPARWWWVELSTLATFLCVMLSRVFFRTDDLSAAGRVLAGLAGRSGVELVAGLSTHWEATLLCIAAYTFCRVAPNSMEVLAAVQPVLGKVRTARWSWRFEASFGVALAVALFASVLLLSRVSAFLYFQF